MLKPDAVSSTSLKTSIATEIFIQTGLSLFGFLLLAICLI